MRLAEPRWWAVAAVWAGTLLAVVIITVAVPGATVWTGLTLAGALSVVVGMVVQLAVGEQDGFVQRMVWTACGSFALVLLAALVRAIVGA
ncbi:MAG: hypothetical protein ACTHJL_13430 [Amnibacterium sp.]